MWLNGPEWLKHQLEPATEDLGEISEKWLLGRKKQSHTLATTQEERKGLERLIKLGKFSCLKKLLRVTALTQLPEHQLRLTGDITSPSSWCRKLTGRCYNNMMASRRHPRNSGLCKGRQLVKQLIHHREGGLTSKCPYAYLSPAVPASLPDALLFFDPSLPALSF